MGTCDNCGNDYHRSFTLTMQGKEMTFDCFECAISMAAPCCKTCNTRIIGHGIEAADGDLYCCAHCGSRDGVTAAVDHVRS